MGKTIILNMEDINLEGDILDVGEKNLGVIYSLSKEAFEELSLDYVDSECKDELESEKYDAGTFFFELNKIWTNLEKERIIKEVGNYIKSNGRILIWDINKERGKVFNNKIKVILPNDKIKEFVFKNSNVLTNSSLEETKKIVEKYFEIEETKLWEDIFFIKAKKKDNKEEIVKDESVTYGS